MKNVLLNRAQVHEGALILVNRAHPLQQQCVGCLADVADGQAPIRMEWHAAQQLSACLQKVGAGKEIVPVSGWRSLKEQQDIWAASMQENGEAFTKQYVAVPGCSEHQTGLAIDLGKLAEDIDFIRPAFPYDGLCGAFRQHAAEYGFIERYQEGKEALTEISAEPWHFRYVGVPHAQLMQENGLCLEEYHDFLREAPRRICLADGRVAQVFYVPASGEFTEVNVPPGDCQISGDNIDGFIITSWGQS